MNQNKCPTCYATNCANNEENRCIALTTNDFEHRKCPFFKTKTQAEKEKAYCEQRLAELYRGKEV